MLTADEAREINKLENTLAILDSDVRVAARKGLRRIFGTFENVSQKEGEPDPIFSSYGKVVREELNKLGYKTQWMPKDQYARPYSGFIAVCDPPAPRERTWGISYFMVTYAFDERAAARASCLNFQHSS